MNAEVQQTTKELEACAEVYGYDDDTDRVMFSIAIHEAPWRPQSSSFNTAASRRLMRCSW
jgi:hypothetical protein